MIVGVGETLEECIIIPLIVIRVNVRGAVDEPLDEGLGPEVPLSLGTLIKLKLLPKN